MALGAPSLPTSAVEPRQLRSLDRATKATGDRQRKRAPRKELQRSGRVTPYWESRSRGDALPLPLVRQIWGQIGFQYWCSWPGSRAHKVACYLRHGHALGEAQDLGIEVEVTLRPAIAAVNLEQLPLPDQVANRHRLGAQRLRLATAPCLVAVLPARATLRSASRSGGPRHR